MWISCCVYNLWCQLCRRSCDEIPQAFSLRFCINVLQVMKTWRRRRPGNEARLCVCACMCVVCVCVCVWVCVCNVCLMCAWYDVCILCVYVYVCVCVVCAWYVCVISNVCVSMGVRFMFVIWVCCVCCGVCLWVCVSVCWVWRSVGRIIELTFPLSSISNFSFCLATWAPSAGCICCIRGCRGKGKCVWVCVKGVWDYVYTMVVLYPH